MVNLGILKNFYNPYEKGKVVTNFACGQTM